MDRPQAAALVILHDLLQEERLVVANTHLLFNSRRGDVKLGQMLLMMRSLWNAVRRNSTVSRKLEIQTDDDQSEAKPIHFLENTPGVLMCGDFNIIPDSCLYQWLRDGHFDFSKLDGESKKKLSGSHTSHMNISYSISAQHILPNTYILYVQLNMMNSVPFHRFHKFINFIN